MNQKNKTSSELYRLLQDVTNHIIAWAKPGMRMCDLDREARRMMGEYSKYFTHSLGHGVGLEIHESPRVSGKSREILRPGMVITIEPGIYGLRIQNTKYKVQNEENSRHSSQARNEREVESIPDNASCTFADKSTKIIQGTKTRYKPISSEELDSSRSNSLGTKLHDIVMPYEAYLTPETPFLNREKREGSEKRQIYGLRYEEMVFVDKEKLVVL